MMVVRVLRGRSYSVFINDFGRMSFYYTDFYGSKNNSYSKNNLFRDLWVYSYVNSKSPVLNEIRKIIKQKYGYKYSKFGVELIESETYSAFAQSETVLDSNLNFIPTDFIGEDNLLKYQRSFNDALEKNLAHIADYKAAPKNEKMELFTLYITTMHRTFGRNWENYVENNEIKQIPEYIENKQMLNDIVNRGF